MWHHRGVESPGALLRALSSRGLGSERGVETSGSGHEVLAIGCREQQKGRGLIVVLDGGGAELREQGRVIEGMERFCPSALVWVYEEGANPPLRGFVEKHESVIPDPAGSVSPKEVGRKAEQPPVLRLAGTNGSSNVLRASDVLDQDELRALLKPDEQA